jgi:DNA repair exonuclease SbcCD ATPase subunit
MAGLIEMVKRKNAARDLFKKYDARMEALSNKPKPPKVKSIDFTAASIEAQIKVQAEMNQELDAEWNEMHAELEEIKELMDSLQNLYEEARILRIKYRQKMTVQSARFMDGVDTYFNFQRVRSVHFYEDGRQSRWMKDRAS